MLPRETPCFGDRRDVELSGTVLPGGSDALVTRQLKVSSAPVAIREPGIQQPPYPDTLKLDRHLPKS